MKKKTIFTVAGLGLLILLFGGNSFSQDIPGFSLGGFYEYRVENEIDDENLTFNYYGARIKFRDERWAEVFIDAGVETLELDPLKDEDAGAFGLGGTFWLMRQVYGYGAFDFGLYGSVHFSEFKDVKSKDGSIKTDIKHYRYMVQGVLRAEINQSLKAFVRGGVLGTKLDPDADIFADDEKDEVKPAINAGVEIDLTPELVLTLEGNFSEGVGGAVHLDYWF